MLNSLVILSEAGRSQRISFGRSKIPCGCSKHRFDTISVLQGHMVELFQSNANSLQILWKPTSRMWNHFVGPSLHRKLPSFHGVPHSSWYPQILDHTEYMVLQSFSSRPVKDSSPKVLRLPPGPLLGMIVP